MLHLKYCRECVMPDTKPFLTLDAAGVCSACRAHRLKRVRLQGIDWALRKAELDALVASARERAAPFYDVLVPVSGGKDSIFQVHTALDYGLRVLAVHVDYGIKTEIGRRNLEIVPRMGATLLSVRPEQPYHNRMIRIGFEDYGDPDLMSHGLLYAYPLWVAVQFAVPLVLEGENSAFEYGGDGESSAKSGIDRDWFSKHVMTRGVTAGEISERYGIPPAILKVYDFPDQALRAADIRAEFLSHYLPWDSEAHLTIAQGYGFATLGSPREGTFRDYVGIDEKINRIHQHMKVLKFGYGRATDHACEEIRNGRMTRRQAVDAVRQYDRQPLTEDYVADFVGLLGYTAAEFQYHLERCRNPEIWGWRNGRWALDDSELDNDR